MFLGIEIGGTKLQLALGPGDGTLAGFWRDDVDPAAGADGIRRQITEAVPELLRQTGLTQSQLRAIGIGFGGPVEDATRTVVKSHQIAGWDHFPLADWISDLVGRPAVLGNDADVAGLAEAHFGAGKGMSPVFYITIGSGIGGGLVIDGKIYRGFGRGAAEIGHLFVSTKDAAGAERRCLLEEVASGWGLARFAQAKMTLAEKHASLLWKLADNRVEAVTGQLVGQAAGQGDRLALAVLQRGIDALAEAIAQMLTLLAPRRIVIGGGVSLLGEDLLFRALREGIAKQVFRPFAELYDIVPARLGEQVVLHGALLLARQLLEGSKPDLART
jgi:glucokinase